MSFLLMLHYKLNKFNIFLLHFRYWVVNNNVEKCQLLYDFRLVSCRLCSHLWTMLIRYFIFVCVIGSSKICWFSVIMLCVRMWIWIVLVKQQKVCCLYMAILLIHHFFLRWYLFQWCLYFVFIMWLHRRCTWHSTQTTYLIVRKF